MGTIRHQTISHAVKVLDLVLMTLSLAAGNLPVLVAAGPLSFEQFLSVRIKLENLLVFMVFLWVWHSVFSIFHLYESRRLSRRLAELCDVIKATSVATLIIATTGFLLKLSMINLTFVV